jgi:TIR domain/zinc-ribbon domain
MGHIFISYSRKDSEFVDRLIPALEQYGFSTWSDMHGIAGGDVWKATISRAVRESDAFLIVLSPQSADSENVAKELAVATKHARRILPVMFQACKIPDKMEYDLAELQWSDFHEHPFHDALEELVRALGGRPTTVQAGSREVLALRDFVLSQAARLIRPVVTAAHGTLPGTPAVTNAIPSQVIEFCIHCGAKLKPGNAFCMECGGAIPRT